MNEWMMTMMMIWVTVRTSPLRKQKRTATKTPWQHNTTHITPTRCLLMCRSLHGVRKTHKTVCWQDYFFKLYVKFHWISVSGTSLVTMDASHYTKTLYLHSLGVATRTLSVAQCFLVFTFMIYFYYASSRLPSRLPFRKKYNINSFASQEIPGR